MTCQGLASENAENPPAKPRAFAVWARGKVTHEVEVRSRPDALGMVDVLALWSGQPARAHRDALTPQNEAATKLLALRETFVTTTASVAKPVVRQMALAPVIERKPPVARLPGERIDWATAHSVFGATGMAGIQIDARLRLLGLANGAVVLRAYDKDGLICERPYQYNAPSPALMPAAAPRPAPTAQPTPRGLPTTRQISSWQQTKRDNAALNALQQKTGKKATKAYVHPAIGTRLGDVTPSSRLCQIYGCSVDKARFAIRTAQQASELAPLGGRACALRAENGQIILIVVAYIVTQFGQEHRQIYAVVDEQDFASIAANKVRHFVVVWDAPHRAKTSFAQCHALREARLHDNATTAIQQPADSPRDEAPVERTAVDMQSSVKRKRVKCPTCVGASVGKCCHCGAAMDNATNANLLPNPVAAEFGQLARHLLCAGCLTALS